ncbi:Isy1-like splicing factor [Coprinellus micaceus]|uniref:Isy1-like splicing factor n=1 Tax=Coprinellus micaceus TaxID=71717 RepID=A0A4Y7TGU6_COPMI|nr:Isy1-like splicing factor [Coprinellus micaceus]
MARNEEKAQSMLYRFREAQAADLGLGTRADRRPRVAAAMQEFARMKVSKIQDAGLTDYEVRDLNDEINKLLREKRNWENQIVALGGANYKRNVAMLDEDGKEVPGTKGYKYFGRAKDLPGVKELFQSHKQEVEEENQALSHYKKFMEPSTSRRPRKKVQLSTLALRDLYFNFRVEYEAARANVQEVLGLSADAIPKFSRPESAVSPTAKRKAVDGDADARVHAEAAAAYIPFLTADNLLPPTLPTREEMEAVLLDLRKKALVEEYFGENAS